MVLLSLLYTLLDDGGLADGGSKLAEYVTLMEESEGFDRAVNLMNEHDDMEVYEKASRDGHNEQIINNKELGTVVK